MKVDKVLTVETKKTILYNIPFSRSPKTDNVLESRPYLLLFPDYDHRKTTNLQTLSLYYKRGGVPVLVAAEVLGSTQEMWVPIDTRFPPVRQVAVGRSLSFMSESLAKHKKWNAS